MPRLLLITYYFPPCGGAGVQRWLRLLPLLSESGYEITVITTRHGDYPVSDWSLLKSIPSGVKVIRTFTPVFGKLWQRVTDKDEPLPYGSLDASQSNSPLKKALYWIRLHLIFPDVRVVWNPFSWRAARKLLQTTRFDWVITTGPPHSTHLVGLALKTQTGVQWLADFRDPWTQIYYLKLNPPNPALQYLNLRLEKQVLQKADVSLVISRAIADKLPAGNKIVFYNGFDARQFKGLSYHTSDRFRVKYIGQLTEGQDIKAMLDFLSTLVVQSGLQEVEFHYVGTNNPVLGEYNFPIFTKAHLPHQEALAEMVQAELLILLINNYSDNLGMLTTKLFEYVASRTPVLCLGPPDGEAAGIIGQAKCGRVFPALSEQAGDYVSQLYQQWQNQTPERNDTDISQWSVQQQIAKLTAILN